MIDLITASLATKTNSFELDCEADFPKPLKTGNSEEKAIRLQRENCIHSFNTGFIPKVSNDRDTIIVTRCSPLISAVSRKRPGDRIWGGSFIGGGGYNEATPEQAAEYLSWSPHWAQPNEADLGDRLDDVHHSLATK